MLWECAMNHNSQQNTNAIFVMKLSLKTKQELKKRSIARFQERTQTLPGHSGHQYVLDRNQLNLLKCEYNRHVL